jgi:mannosyltransferase OCH1-like enzyme
MVQKTPKLIHPTWKTDRILSRWSHMVDSVKRFHPD